MGSAIIETLAAAVGAAKVRTDDATLRERRHDYWVISHLNDIQGRPAPKPACVVQPDSMEDVVAVVMRQYDAIEANRNFPDHANQGETLLIMIHEGPDAKVEAELAGIREIAEIMELTPANEEVVAEWFEERNDVRSWDYYIERGMILDTIEVSAPWDKIGGIYRDVIQAIQPDPATGILGASGHSSHVYRTGINLYFTFAATPEDPEAMTGLYEECWRRVMEATAAGGGGIAHHHGIGRLRKNYLPLDLGEGGTGLLRTLKQALDPTDFMNPGVLIPDA